MKPRVYYVSTRESAAQIAQAIAHSLKCTREPLMPAYMPESVALMFLGCEGNRADKVTMDFISALNPNRVTNAALFHCGNAGQALAQMRRALTARGVNVLDLTLNAPLKHLFGAGPQGEDLERAAQFAQDCMTMIG